MPLYMPHVVVMLSVIMFLYIYAFLHDRTVC